MIANHRAEVAMILAANDDVGQVWDYLPDDVAALPATVVEAPRGLRSSTLGAAGFDLRVRVFVIGRRLGDRDASAELDKAADAALDTLTAAPGWIVDQWAPDIITVAGVEVPVVVLTVEATVALDCTT